MTTHPIIEHGIEMPQRGKCKSEFAVLLDMKPGDSILVPVKKMTHWRQAATARGLKVTVRSVSETEARLWRVA